MNRGGALLAAPTPMICPAGTGLVSGSLIYGSAEGQHRLHGIQHERRATAVASPGAVWTQYDVGVVVIIEASKRYCDVAIRVRRDGCYLDRRRAKFILRKVGPKRTKFSSAMDRLSFWSLHRGRDDDDSIAAPPSALLYDLCGGPAAVSYHDPIQNDLGHGEVILFEINQRLISVIADH